MTFQELLHQCDYRKIAEIWRGWLSDGGEIENTERAAAAIEEFYKMLEVLSANPSEDLFVAMPYVDDGVCHMGVELYRKKDFLEKCKQAVGIQFPVYSRNDGQEFLSGRLNETEDWFPQSYGYDFTPWEELMAAEVIQGNIERYGLDLFLADVLYEMSFHGMTRESVEERLHELEQSIEEYKRIRNMPEEERGKYLHSLDDVMKELGYDDTRTEEEKAAERRDMLLDMLDDRRLRLDEMKKIAEEMHENEG